MPLIGTAGSVPGRPGTPCSVAGRGGVGRRGEGWGWDGTGGRGEGRGEDGSEDGGKRGTK